MQAFIIYSLGNFHIYLTTVLTIVLNLHITSAGLIYLITGRWYLLSTLIQFPLPSLSPSDNHKSDLFFSEFGDFFRRFHGVVLNKSFFTDPSVEDSLLGALCFSDPQLVTEVRVIVNRENIV